MIFYALCSPTLSRLNRKNVGEKAIWHPDFLVWVFRERSEAELVAQAYSDKNRVFSVCAISCPELLDELNGDSRTRNIMNLKRRYSDSIYELVHLQSKFDIACHQMKINPEEVETNDGTYEKEKKYLQDRKSVV